MKVLQKKRIFSKHKPHLQKYQLANIIISIEMIYDS